jgi:predicted peptidase
MPRPALMKSWRYPLALGVLLAAAVPNTTRGDDAAAPQEKPAVADESPTTDQLDKLYEARTVRVAPAKDAEPVDFAYRLLKPAAIASGARYPLVIFLHGAGERGNDNLNQLKYFPTWIAQPSARQAHPCFVLAPQCRDDQKWVDVDWSKIESTPQSPTPTGDMLAVIAAFEETLKREPVDPTRISLTGLSMGGYGSWDLAARMPERFAAVLPICGGGDEATAAKIKDLPIWCFHGDADTAVRVERSRTMIEALRAAGGAPKYSELAGVGHDSWTPAYRDPDVLAWLFAQKKPAKVK